MAAKEMELKEKSDEVMKSQIVIKEKQEYLERKEEEVVRLRQTCKDLKEDNEHLLASQANLSKMQISDEALEELQSLKQQN